MLIDLHMKDVGPAEEMSIAFKPRMNFITGADELDKTFLLDVAWWALTRTWARGPFIPRSFPATPRLSYLTAGAGRAYDAGFDRWSDTWGKDQGPDRFTDLVLYARVDGGVSVCEPTRSDDHQYAFHFTADELWHGNDASEGLIRDWASWQREGGDPYSRLMWVLKALSPSPAHPLRAGDVRRISINDPKHYPTLAMPYGEDVPIIHASAGMRRIISLVYALIWLWQEHLDACKLFGREPNRQIVFLIDEIEAHLHPQWQRRIVPALLDVMKALTGEDGISVQFITVTHSPLVLASAEPDFDPDRDAIWTLDLDDARKVTLEEFPYSRQGSADNWLTSIFDLDEAGLVPAERWHTPSAVTAHQRSGFRPTDCSSSRSEGQPTPADD